MENITLAEVLGAIVLIGAAAAVIINAVKPALKLGNRVGTLERKADNDYNAIEDISNLQKATGLAIVQMINHMVDGNHVDKLQETRDNLLRTLLKTDNTRG